MKKHLFEILVLTCVFIMSACGDSQSEDGDSDSEYTSEQDDSEIDTEQENESGADGDLDSEVESAEADQTELDTEVDDTEQIKNYAWPKCTSVPSDKTLAEKAAYFDMVAKERHLAPDGLIRNIYLNEDLETVEKYYHVPSTMLWTGMYLASQAFRYAVTKDKEIIQTAKKILEGLHNNMLVTGHAGLYGRSHSRPDVNYAGDTSGNPTWADSPAEGFEGWRFNFDVSKDSYDGLFFGYAVAWLLFDDPEIKSAIKDRLQELMDEFIGNGLQIKDYIKNPEGEVTEHGRLMVTAADDWPGFNALLASSWIKVSEVVTQDSAIEEFYYGCLMKTKEVSECPQIDDPLIMEMLEIESYLDAMEKPLMELFTPNCDQNYDSFDMSYQAIYPLIIYEKDPDLKQRFIQIMKNKLFHTENPEYQSIATYGNSYFTFSYAALCGDDPAEDKVLYDAVDLAICTLKEFPEEKFQRYIPKGEQEVACTNRSNEPCAAERIPLTEYDFDNYLWRLDFFQIMQQEIQQDRRMVYSPEDFLIAYWLARYHKIISEDM